MNKRLLKSVMIINMDVKYNHEEDCVREKLALEFHGVIKSVRSNSCHIHPQNTNLPKLKCYKRT